MKRLLVLPLVFAAAIAQGADEAAKPDVAKGQEIASTVCAGCHGADGNSMIPDNPKLAGQIEAYLLKQLRNFKAADGKSAERENAIMNGMVIALADADMQSVAAYYSAQQLKPESASGSKESLDLGQRLWRGGDAERGIPACAGCHGPAGAGLPAQYPRVAGQYAKYTATQLQSFRSGTRANDANRMMRMIAAKLSDAEIAAVADYAAGLRGNPMAR